jgi:plastocyanin
MRSIAALAALTSLLVLGISSGAADGRGAEASGGATVRISGFEYHPGTIVVHRGAKVVFSNADGVAHTATRRGSFSTGRIKPGHSVAVRFGRRGRFSYFCRIHPYMHGKIVVR